MRIPSKLPVAAIAWLWSAGALHAGLITLSLDPTGGAIAILPGQTSGWGFTLDNQTAGWISVTSSALTFETNSFLPCWFGRIAFGRPLQGYRLRRALAKSDLCRSQRRFMKITLAGPSNRGDMRRYRKFPRGVQFWFAYFGDAITSRTVSMNERSLSKACSRPFKAPVAWRISATNTV